MRRLRHFFPADVELHYSRTGVPRVRARSARDGFTALGVLHAWDRATQMALAYFAATGTICEHLGYRPSLLAMDRTARALRFSRPDPHGPARDGHGLLTAYLDGVARVFDTGRRSLLLRGMGVKLPCWGVEQMSALVRFLSYNLSHTQGKQELAILRAVASGRKYERAWALMMPQAFEGFDPSALDGLTVNAAPYTIVRPTDAVRRTRPPRDPLPVASAPASNNWAVGRGRSATGGAILCNDPHLSVNTLPGFWYQAEIITPDLYVLGFTVPGTPAFMGGWNGDVAWGITHSATDSEDLVIEECREGSARRADGWRQVDARHEIIGVRHASPDRIAVYGVDAGLLHGDPTVPGRYLRRVWGGATSSTSRTLSGLLDLLFTKTAASGLDAVRRAEAVDLNWVLADRRGDIGYQLSGMPLAHATEHAGLLPRAGWSAGFSEPRAMAPQELPRVVNPDSGILVTANNRLVVDGYPTCQSLPFAPDRADRIRAVLSNGAPLTVRAMQKLHYDVESRQARRVMKLCLDCLPESDTILRNWDCRFTAESRAATLFHAFNRALLRDVFAHRFAPAVLTEELLSDGFLELASSHQFEGLYGPDSALFTAEQWREIVQRAYRAAAAAVSRRARRPPRWGRANRLIMRHQLLGHSILGSLVNEGPIQYHGHSSTVFQGLTYNHGAQNEHTTGPTYHMIVDFSARTAYTNLAGGRTERALHRDYRLGIASWLTGRYERFVHPSEDNFH